MITGTFLTGRLWHGFCEILWLVGAMMQIIIEKFAQSIKIILTVLGIISAYPEVSSDNFFVYRSLKDHTIINGQFRCGNLINSPLHEIIDSGISVNIIYNVSTKNGSLTVYKDIINRNIRYNGTNYFLNNSGPYSFNIMTNILSVQELVFLTNADRYAGLNFETEVRIVLSCDMEPQIINLWGNRPKVLLYYTVPVIKDKDQ
jgi:hypothetical protein